MSVLNDIKNVLDFYQALGFERLPVKIRARDKGQGAKQNAECGMRNAEFQSKIQNPKSKIGFSELRTPNSEPNSSLIAYPQSHKSAALNALRKEIGDCQRCKLFKGRKNLVFGEGSPDAALMFIGEGPGRDEDIQGRPFVGDAGKLLTRLIEKMGFKREGVYIGNIVKCRPPLNRDPEEDEMRACLPFIERQVEIISPKVIVALGRISAQAIIGTKVPITKLRGRLHEYKGIPLMPTFHPAYLLRNPKDKTLVWEDAQKVLEQLSREGGQAGK